MPDAQIVAQQHPGRTNVFIQEVDNKSYKSLPTCTGVSERNTISPLFDLDWEAPIEFNVEKRARCRAREMYSL